MRTSSRKKPPGGVEVRGKISNGGKGTGLMARRREQAAATKPRSTEGFGPFRLPSPSRIQTVGRSPPTWQTNPTAPHHGPFAGGPAPGQPQAIITAVLSWRNALLPLPRAGRSAYTPGMGRAVRRERDQAGAPDDPRRKREALGGGWVPSPSPWPTGEAPGAKVWRLDAGVSVRALLQAQTDRRRRLFLSEDGHGFLLTRIWGEKFPSEDTGVRWCWQGADLSACTGSAGPGFFPSRRRPRPEPPD